MIGVRYVGVILLMGLMLFMGVILVSKEIVTPGTVIAFSSLCTSVRGLLEISNTILKTWRRSLAGGYSCCVHERAVFCLSQGYAGVEAILHGSEVRAESCVGG